MFFYRKFTEQQWAWNEADFIFWGQKEYAKPIVPQISEVVVWSIFFRLLDMAR